MFSSKRHIGRPSNKEISQRKIKKILLFVIPSIIIIGLVTLISGGSLNNLMGNSVLNESYYCSEGKLSQDKCIIYTNPYVVGDINVDDVINTKDLQTLIISLNSNKISVNDYPWYDINGDGAINTTDIDAMDDVLNTYGVATSGTNLNIGSNVNKTDSKDISSGSLYNETIIGEKVCKHDAILEKDKCKKIVSAEKKDEIKPNASQNKSTNNKNNQISVSENNNSNTFTIKYDSNGGTGEMADQVIAYGTPTDTRKNKFTKEGYNFIGWKVYNETTKKYMCYINSDQTERGSREKSVCEKYGYFLYHDNHNVHTTAKPGETVKFIAQWNNKFTIKYDSNGGTGEMADQVIAYGTPTDTRKNKFTKEGYNFIGWKVYNETTKKYMCYINSDQTERGSREKSVCEKYGYFLYHDNHNVHTTAKPGETVKFIAQWNNKFTIKYDSNGGTGEMADQVIAYGTPTDTRKNKFTKEGYNFIGWKVYNETTKKYMCYINSDQTERGSREKSVCEKYGYFLYHDNHNVHTTAKPGETVKFIAQWNNKFTIKYDSNGGTGEMADQVIAYGTPTDTRKNKFKKEGHNFVGWKVYNISTKKYMCYTDSNQTERGSRDKSVCEKYGYFLYHDNHSVQATAKPGETVKFIAQWNNKFTIKYNSNGGTGKMSNQKITYGQSTKLKTNDFKKEGYVFLGWKVYNETTKKYMCYTSQGIEKQSSSDIEVCNNYGFALYGDAQNVAKTASPGQNLIFTAQWVLKHKNYYEMNYSTVLTVKSSDTSRPTRNVQDLYVEGNNFYISHDYPGINGSNTKKQVLITLVKKTGNTPNSYVTTKNAFLSPTNCGHGMFEKINGGYLLSCDPSRTVTNYNNASSSCIYKKMDNGEFKQVANVMSGAEIIKLNGSRTEAMIRKSDGVYQTYKWYTYDNVNDTLGELLSEFKIKATSNYFQGHDIENGYLYILSGEADTATYVQVYKLTKGMGARSIKTVKISKMCGSYDFCEPEGISVSGNYVFIGHAVREKSGIYGARVSSIPLSFLTN